MSIWSHGDGISIDSQSAAREEASAHKETGLGPTRSNPIAIAQLRSLFTTPSPYNSLKISIAHIATKRM